jgi:hypothetical protein
MIIHVLSVHASDSCQALPAKASNVHVQLAMLFDQPVFLFSCKIIHYNMYVPEYFVRAVQLVFLKTSCLPMQVLVGYAMTFCASNGDRCG